MKKLSISLFIILICVLVISSCTKCPKLECSTLNDSDKQWIPYRNYDSLVFKNFKNDSIIYYISSKFSSYKYSGGENSKGCDTYCFEYNSIYLSFLDSNQDGLTDGKKSLKYYVQKENEQTYVYGYPGFYSMDWEIDCSSPRMFFNLKCATLHDSISINNQWIKHVYQCKYNHQQVEIDEIFLKHQKGIVKIVFLDGQEFELVEHIISDIYQK